MSQAAVRSFYDTVAGDPAIAERYKSMLMSNKNAPQAAVVAAAVDFARREGFDFSTADLEAVGQQEKNKPLTDEQLDRVAGAGSVGWVVIGPDSGGTGFCIVIGYNG